MDEEFGLDGRRITPTDAMEVDQFAQINLPPQRTTPQNWIPTKTSSNTSASGRISPSTTTPSTVAASTTSTILPTKVGPQRYQIRGVSVDYPYPAYDCQQVYMEKVIQSLQLSQHALLESPTGTGKTLCLLCAALAWRSAFVAATDLQRCPPSALQAELSSKLQTAAMGAESLNQPTSSGRNSPYNSTNSGSMCIPSGDGMQSVDGLRHLYGLDRDVALGGDVSLSSRSGAMSNSFIPAGASINSMPAKPKIIYASRTHSQLAKVVSELKQSIYRPKLTILGSRQQLCVHPVVSKLEGAGQTHACRSLTAEHACNYYEHLQTWTTENQALERAVLDIEDLTLLGKEQHMCPYFYSRDRMADAELVLLPYNYLIDPTIRNRLGLKFENSIVIFDEAHNLEGVCGDSASFDLSAADLAAAIQEVQKCIDTIRDPVTCAMVMDGGSLAGNDIPDLESLAILKAILLEFEQLLDRQSLPDNGDGLTKPGEFIFELFAQCKIQHENKDMLLQLLDRSVNLLFADRVQESQRKSCALDKFSNAIKIIFKGNQDNCMAMARFYRVHIHTKEPQQRSTAASSSTKKSFFDNNKKQSADVGRILSYWCFNPGIAMQDLTQVGIRCMILTSGTLSPMESFQHELNLPFPIKLENPHVIQPEQIWVGVLEKGPASHQLISNFQSRENAEYISDLGNAVVNFSRIVPDGLLVFFPSYSVLQGCYNAWKVSSPPTNTSVVDRITRHKALVVEPRVSADFLASIKEFEEKLDDTAYSGAVFFAVCRGKVSEGLDFADRAGRAVIVTGLPYPAYKDPKVRLKRRFLDEAARTPGIKQLSGTEWYGQQAARAVNQAIGRVIRHRGDYGAIILADSRFGPANVRKQLSSWIRPYVQTYNTFGTCVGSLTKFFQQAQINYPEKTRTKSDGVEQAKRLGQDGALSYSKQVDAARRGANGLNSTATPKVKSNAMVGADFEESFDALADGLLDSSSSSQSDPPLAQQEPIGRVPHSNPTLIVKKSSLSFLSSLLKPASTTTQTHSTSLTKSTPTTASTAASKPPLSTNRLLNASRLQNSGTPIIKVEMEIDDHERKSSPLDYRAPVGSQKQTTIKSEPQFGLSQPTQSGRASPIMIDTPPTAAAAAAASFTTTAPPVVTKPPAEAIKNVVGRVKSSLTNDNFPKFKDTLRKLSELKSATPTEETYFQHVAAVNGTVQMLASLLFGFDSNVLKEQTTSTGTSPLDSQLAIAFEPHIPGPYRPQYTKAIQAILTQYPKSSPPAPKKPPSIFDPRPGVKTEPKPNATAVATNQPSSTTPAVVRGLKRENSLTQSQSSAAPSSSTQLPPPSTQLEFVSRIKAKLSQADYEKFKSIIIDLERAPTPNPPNTIPPALLTLFQSLQQVLDNLTLLRAYGNLIPTRLRPTFQQFLNERAAVAALRWTGAVTIDLDEDENQEETNDRNNPKRPKLEPKMPHFTAKTIVRTQ